MATFARATKGGKQMSKVSTRICKTCGKEKPIFFNTKMIQAILDGRKIMTRRTVKNIPEGTHRVEQIGESLFEAHWGIHGNSMFLDGATEIKCPYQPGDRLWVRETWQCIKYDSMDGDLSYGVEFKDGTRKHFEFDDNERFHQFGKYAFKEGWQQSIHMPKEAARIWLEVTNVRVERLQEILCNDMRREGCIPTTVTGGQYQQWHRDYWIPLWDSTIKKQNISRYGWTANPWVWVIEFERMKEDVNT